jgi:ubiquitin-like-conjugating enzyme ATG10
MLSTFPHLTTEEFAQACSDLRRRYHERGSSRGDWQSVEIIPSTDTPYLRIAKELRKDAKHDAGLHVDSEDDEVEENDDEVLNTSRNIPALIHYDIILSPVYQAPVLYFGISDPLHRYPPTMTTLYEHLIPSHFKAQAENAGVIGGVTINDHPSTNRPVFFIHPCQTAEVMEASVGNKAITAEEYLLIWVGALGGCVGLNVPLALMRQETSSTMEL